MLTYDDLPDLGLSYGKTWSKQFQLCFPAYHEKLAKLNEKQYIITKNFSTMFWGKNHQGMLWSRRDPSRHQRLSEWYHRDNMKTHRGEVTKSPGNINYSKFPLERTNYVIGIGEVRNSNFFQRGVVLQIRFFPGSSPGRFSRGTETGCKNSSSHCRTSIFCRKI